MPLTEMVNSKFLLRSMNITPKNEMIKPAIFQSVSRSFKKKNAALVKYWNLIEEKYPKMHHSRDYIDNAIAFWMKDGTHILICEYKKGCYSITLIGNIIFEGVKITDSILNYIEMKDTLDNCVKKGIELLMEHNR